LAGLHAATRSDVCTAWVYGGSTNDVYTAWVQVGLPPMTCIQPGSRVGLPPMPCVQSGSSVGPPMLRIQPGSSGSTANDVYTAWVQGGSTTNDVYTAQVQWVYRQRRVYSLGPGWDRRLHNAFACSVTRGNCARAASASVCSSICFVGPARRLQLRHTVPRDSCVQHSAQLNNNIPVSELSQTVLWGIGKYRAETMSRKFVAHHRNLR
jgi:hypothetical protein